MVIGCADQGCKLDLRLPRPMPIVDDHHDQSCVGRAPSHRRGPKEDPRAPTMHPVSDSDSVPIGGLL
jgi:hypothetical protein